MLMIQIKIPLFFDRTAGVEFLNYGFFVLNGFRIPQTHRNRRVSWTKNANTVMVENVETNVWGGFSMRPYGMSPTVPNVNKTPILTEAARLRIIFLIRILFSILNIINHLGSHDGTWYDYET